MDLSERKNSPFFFFFLTCAGDIGGVMLSNNSDYNTSGQNYMAGSSQHPFAPLYQPNNSNPFSFPPYNPPMNNINPQVQQPYYPPPMQPPPPPSNAGYMPTYIPRSENVVNIASSSSSSGAAAGRGYGRPGPGFAAGIGVGAVGGAGVALYGGDYMAGFDLPTSLPKPSVSISIDPPF